MSELIKNAEYQYLIEQIGKTYQTAKDRVVSAVNTEMLKAYWEIGRYIIEFEQGGKIEGRVWKIPAYKPFKRPYSTTWVEVLVGVISII